MGDFLHWDSSRIVHSGMFSNQQKRPMNANVIDTERYATRLKDAGVEDRVANATARALNDELLASNLVTKQDLKAAITELRTEMLAKFQVVDARFEGVNARFEGVNARFDALDTKFEGLEGKFEGLEGKFTGLEAKVEALASKLDTTSRYTFLILALLVALGLFNTIEPRLWPSETAVASEPANAAPKSPAAQSQATPEAQPSANTLSASPL